jgi:hypothetical protein
MLILFQKMDAVSVFIRDNRVISKLSQISDPLYLYFSFALRPGRPHHRNAAASGANGYLTFTLKSRAPAKAAYAAMDNLFYFFTTKTNIISKTLARVRGCFFSFRLKRISIPITA